MINKIICFLFGHIFYEDLFSGNYGKAYDRLLGVEITVPIKYRKRTEFCPRCGKDLQVKNSITNK
jgi:hypothetical protein